MEQKDTPTVCVINQDYAFGHAISRAAKEMLAAKRPDINVVVTICTPTHGKGPPRRTSPKLRLRVLTGKWESDLSFVIEARKRAKLDVVSITP